MVQNHLEVVDDLSALRLDSNFDLLFGHHDLFFVANLHLLEHHRIILICIDLPNLLDQHLLVSISNIQEVGEAATFVGFQGFVDPHDGNVETSLEDITEVEEFLDQRELGPDH